MSKFMSICMLFGALLAVSSPAIGSFISECLVAPSIIIGFLLLIWGGIYLSFS